MSITFSTLARGKVRNEIGRSTHQIKVGVKEGQMSEEIARIKFALERQLGASVSYSVLFLRAMEALGRELEGKPRG